MTLRTLPLIFALAACGGSAPEAPEEEAPEAEEAPEVEEAHDDEAHEEGEAHDGEAAHDEHEGHDMGKTGGFVPVDAEGAKVFFVAPADGGTVQSPVHVVFGAEALTVQAAGTLEANTGHHHVIVNGEAVPAGQAVPKDDTHIHYGKGQTEADLELPPGEHTLTMQFADGAHRSYGPGLSATITVTVEAPEGE